MIRFSNKLLLQLLALATFILPSSIFAQDCNNDNTAPIAICNTGLEVNAIDGFGFNLWALDIDEGSYDNCSSVDYRLELSENSQGTVPVENSVFLPPILGDYTVILWVGDESGNWNQCYATVIVVGIQDEGCTEDTEAPTPVCIDQTYELDAINQMADVNADHLAQNSTDNCDDALHFQVNLLNQSTSAPQGSSQLSLSSIGTYTVEVWVIDDFGNTAPCQSTITVVPNTLFDCENDVIQPIAICENFLTLAHPGVGITIQTQDIDDGSYDNCSNLDYRIELSEDTQGTPPETTTIQLPPVLNDYEVTLWVGDSAGNWNQCATTVTINGVFPAGCTEDTEAPIPICINLDIPLDDFLPVLTLPGELFGQASTDNCDQHLDFQINLLDQSTGAPQGSANIGFSETGTYALEVWVIDDSGNTSSCQTYVVVTDNPLLDCDNDIIAPTAICTNGLQAHAHPETGLTLWAQDIDEGSYDNCSDVTLRLGLLEDFDDGPPETASLNFPPVLGEYDIVLWVGDDSGNWNSCWTSVEISGITYSFNGSVFKDFNDNCTLDMEEEDSGFEGWKIRASYPDGQVFFEITTDASGDYNYNFIAPTQALQLEVILPNGLSTGCSSSVLLSDFESTASTTTNFAIPSIDGCTYLTVDVSTPFLRRCFDNTYFVNYSNYSGDAAENANITLILDPFMGIVDASLSYTDLGDNRYLFDLGTIPGNSGGSFTVTTLLFCEADLGQTHCVEAQILPFTCVPEDDFAELVVEGDCDEELGEVHFKVTNIGETATTAALASIIVEDVIMYMQSPINLGAGESTDFFYDANGATWRLEVEQDPSFPFGGFAANFVEGCGGFTPNMATQFLLNSPKPNVTYDCQENIGSWDPNDKQAFPRGYADEHFIKANTPIEYLIRFQNTGTDTAFNIVVEDQLSEWLDPASIRPGASSHPYRLEQKEDGNLLFHFDNIMLPDSNINLVGSNGFVKFSIDQYPDLALGTVIENTADIYFDFNEAVVTNTVHHTIGEDVVLVATQEVFVDNLSIDIRPNPLQTEGQLILHNFDCQDGQLLLFDMTGRQLQTQSFIGNEVALNRSQFPVSGLYFFNILEKGQLIAQGKLLVQ